jgi:hypothetical protein
MEWYWHWEIKYLEKTISQRHFVHHKSNTDRLDFDKILHSKKNSENIWYLVQLASV